MMVQRVIPSGPNFFEGAFTKGVIFGETRSQTLKLHRVRYCRGIGSDYFFFRNTSYEVLPRANKRQEPCSMKKPGKYVTTLVLANIKLNAKYRILTGMFCGMSEIVNEIPPATMFF